MKKRQFFLEILFVSLFFTLVACGGGGSGSETTETPIINRTIEPKKINVGLLFDGKIPEGPSIATNGSRIIVAWSDINILGYHNIYLTRSTDGGASFPFSENLSKNEDDEGDSGVIIITKPVVIMNDSNVLVAWSYFTEKQGGTRIFITRSTDGGVSFSTPVNFFSGFNSLGELSMAFNDTNVVIAWHQLASILVSNIYLARSTDNGVSFSTPVNISNASKNAENPSVAISGSNILVAWSQETVLTTTRSTDGGVSFSTPVNLNASSLPDLKPLVVMNGSNILIVWGKKLSSSGNNEVNLLRSIDGGISFFPSVNLSKDLFASEHSIAMDDSNIVIAWAALVGSEHKIFITRSTDGGVSFSPTVNFFKSSEISKNPSVAISGTDALIVWRETLRFTHDTIFFTRID